MWDNFQIINEGILFEPEQMNPYSSSYFYNFNHGVNLVELEGKNCLITGAARGMGAAVAEHYAEQGANVCVADLNIDGCNEVVARIKEKGGKAIAVKLNVTERDQMQAAVKATVDAFGSLNVMVNNAGINKPLMFLDITEDGSGTKLEFLFSEPAMLSWLQMRE